MNSHTKLYTVLKLLLLLTVSVATVAILFGFVIVVANEMCICDYFMSCYMIDARVFL